MIPSLSVPGAGKDAVATESVAGRIQAEPALLSRAICEWAKSRSSRGNKPKGVRAYREVVARCAADMGWSKPDDVTFESASAWLSQKRATTWKKGTTYNRNLVCLRSFSRWMRRMKLVAEDPLQDMDRAIDDGDDGARAALLDEARGMIREAWLRGLKDRRCKGNRALTWMCLFAAAMRAGEPEQLLRRHVVLDHAPPFIDWKTQINKNGKHQQIAICEEFAVLLRHYAAAVDREREEDGLTPLGEDDKFFLITAERPTFRRDRERLGIPAKDKRGRKFSPHSARKFFSTELTRRGVPEKIVDAMMRHAGKTEARYFDATLEDQAEALKKMPRLWPEAVENLVDNSRGSLAGREIDLTKPGERAEDMPAGPDPKGTNSSEIPRPSATGPASGRRRGGTDECNAGPPTGAPSRPAEVRSAQVMTPEMPRGGFIISVDRKSLADLLGALERLLRSGAADGQVRELLSSIVEVWKRAG